MSLTYYLDLAGSLNHNCFTPGRDGNHVRALVCHSTCGPKDFNGQGRDIGQALSDAAASYLASNNREVSAHYLVGAEDCGAPLYRIVPEGDTAYHCGGTPPAFPSNWVDPDTSLRYGGFNLNEVAIGVEVFGQATDKLGLNQLATLKNLVRYLVAQYPILRKPGHIVSHASLEGDRQDGKNWVEYAKGWTTQIGGAGKPVANSKHFDQTGFDVSGPFLDYWQANGGVPIFGYPISSERPASDFGFAQAGSVQYFERARFEWWNINGRVELGLIGYYAITKDQPTKKV